MDKANKIKWSHSIKRPQIIALSPLLMFFLLLSIGCHTDGQRDQYISYTLELANNPINTTFPELFYLTSSLFDNNENNEETLAGVTRGNNTCRFFYFNLDNPHSTYQADIPCNGAWGICHNNGLYYIGTYMPAKVYEIHPREKFLKEIFSIPSEQFIWCISKFNNFLFFGTYPGGKIYELNLDNATTFVYGPLKNEKYIRSIFVDAGSIFAGTGTNAKFFKIDRETKNIEEIYHSSLGGNSFVYQISNINKYIFLFLSPSYKTLLFSLDKGSFVKEYETYKTAPLSLPTLSDQVYHFSGVDRLLEFDPTNQSLRWISPSSTANEFACKALADGRMAFIDSAGSLRIYSRVGAVISEKPLSDYGIHGEKVLPHSISFGNDYICAGIGSQIFLYSISRKQWKGFFLGKEAQRIVFSNGYFFLASYPGADIFRINPNNFFAGQDANASLLGKSGIGQNRPKCMQTSIDGNTIALGTEPDYGKYGGSLTIIQTDSLQIQNFPNIVGSLTVSSIAGLDSNGVYIGTSRFGGGGTNILPQEVKILYFDIQQKKTTWEFSLPLNFQNVNSMVIKNGNIFILDQSHSLGVIDTLKKKLIYEESNSKIRKIFAGSDSKIYAFTNVLFGVVDESNFQLNPIFSNYTGLEEVLMPSPGSYIFQLSDKIFSACKF